MKFYLVPRVLFFADLVFWLYYMYIVSQLHAIPLHQDSKICDTKQSITERKLDWQKLN